MYNYYFNIICKIDIALLALALILSLAIIISASLDSLERAGRKKALLRIKSNIFEILSSGKGVENNVCLPITMRATPQQFLDIQSNRDREAVFFNEAEQKFFKECFASPKKIAKLKNMAKRPFGKWRRIEAIMCLGYLADESALKILSGLLYSKDEDISYFSMIALGQIGTIGSAKTLISFLKKNAPYRYKIASLLEGFPAGITKDIIELLEEREPAVRFWALKLLSKFKNNAYLNKIKKLTGDVSAEVRAGACECLGAMGDVSSAADIQKCLGDREWMVRSSAILALSDILGDRCIPFVLDRINDGSLSVIDAVKKVITKHAEKAIPHILKIFEGKDNFAKTVCLEALENSGSEAATAAAIKLKRLILIT